ncbi:hypothetical protein T484DRAFT_2704236 [Baffinella frigidus]|nr:hypothetical protein T484DRAFT_2704236 [Cryptophyta sp. CCMP2293]
MRPLIRVRVVDKRLKDGKYYLKKGQILDVIARGIASVRMEDDGRMLDEVNVAQLETVPPKP